MSQIMKNGPEMYDWPMPKQYECCGFTLTGMQRYSDKNPDYKQAIQWFEKGCDCSDPMASYCLGVCYMKGKGVIQNADTAIRYWGHTSQFWQQNAPACQYANNALNVCVSKGWAMYVDGHAAVQHKIPVAGHTKTAAIVNATTAATLQGDPSFKNALQIQQSQLTLNQLQQRKTNQQVDIPKQRPAFPTCVYLSRDSQLSQNSGSGYNNVNCSVGARNAVNSTASNLNVHTGVSANRADCCVSAAVRGVNQNQSQDAAKCANPRSNRAGDAKPCNIQVAQLSERTQIDQESDQQQTVPQTGQQSMQQSMQQHGQQHDRPTVSTIDASKLAKLYAHGLKEPESDKQMFQMLNDAKYTEDPDILCAIGQCHQFGWGVDKNFTVAVQYYVMAADAGSWQAMVQLKECSQEMSADQLKRIFEYFTARVGSENARAQFNAGFCHYWGIGTDENCEQACILCTAAKQNGSSNAAVQMGLQYQFGHGVVKNEALAFDLYSQAATAGNREGYYNLAFCYKNGVAVPKNVAKAVKLLEQAAALGHAQAANNLGICYQCGVGGVKDEMQVFQWYKQAAIVGNARGQYNIGNCYRVGRGVEPDHEKAVYWYGKAAAQGLLEAATNLSFCCGERGHRGNAGSIKCVQQLRQTAANAADATNEVDSGAAGAAENAGNAAHCCVKEQQENTVLQVTGNALLQQGKQEFRPAENSPRTDSQCFDNIQPDLAKRLAAFNAKTSAAGSQKPPPQEMQTQMQTQDGSNADADQNQSGPPRELEAFNPSQKPALQKQTAENSNYGAQCQQTAEQCYPTAGTGQPAPDCCQSAAIPQTVGTQVHAQTDTQTQANNNAQNGCNCGFGAEKTATDALARHQAQYQAWQQNQNDPCTGVVGSERNSAIGGAIGGVVNSTFGSTIRSTIGNATGSAIGSATGMQHGWSNM